MNNSFIDFFCQIIDEKFGKDIALFDVRNINPLVDYVLVCGARNEANASSIYQEIFQSADKKQYRVYLKEKIKGSGWYLIQVEELLIHIFFDGKREYYALEELWKDLRIYLK